ncbi:MAG: DASS family sodium-coupled anion symporter [Pirellulales bacterium]
MAAQLRYPSLAAGLLLSVGTFFATRHFAMPPSQCITAAVTVLCACWWIFESLPLEATSLVPFAVFPLLGVLTERDVGAAYGDPIVLLFMGGFMLAQAAEACGAHRRLAHSIVAAIGNTSARRLILAFMIATAFVSMWVSNTAAALMMLPVAMAVIECDTEGRLHVPLLLGIAYSASIGGVATPIGTPPNGVFLANYTKITGGTVPFHEWLLLGGTVAVLMLAVTWLVLTWKLGGVKSVDVEIEGTWTTTQKRVLAVLALAALAWITREIPYGGWSALLERYIGPTEAGDTTVALVAVVILFLVPRGDSDGKRLLDWSTAKQIPWGVLLLFGGGIAIAKAFDASGLSTSIGSLVDRLQDWPTLAVIGTLCLLVTFFSEFTSNTATSNILMPILAAAAVANKLDPALLMFPATLSNSLAFMMPVGTPPNALVFATGRVRIADMVRYGFILNLASTAIVTLVCWKLLPVVFGGD